VAREELRNKPECEFRSGTFDKAVERPSRHKKETRDLCVFDRHFFHLELVYANFAASFLNPDFLCGQFE